MEINLSNLTEEQRKQLFEQMKEEEKAKEQKKQQIREEYKNLVSETVQRNFEKLKGISEVLSKVKKEVFEDFETALEMKAELYGIKENQQSHTFTTPEGLSITIGHRVTDNFDDTVLNGMVVGADAIDITDDVMAELTNEQMQNNNGK